MTGNSQQRRRLRHISWRFFFFERASTSNFCCATNQNNPHILKYVSCDRSRLLQPCGKFFSWAPLHPSEIFYPLAPYPPGISIDHPWGGGGGIWIFSGITHLKVFINEPSFQTNFVVANKKSESVPKNNLIAFWHRMKQEAKTVILLYFRKSHMNWVTMLWKWMS